MAARAAITSLALDAFRNYDHQSMAVTGHGPVVLLGENGAGKTNCLEAISLLSPGRGLRSATMAEWQNAHVPRPWAIALQLENRDGQAQIGIGRDPDNLDKRILRIDGKTARSLSALPSLVQTLWLTPERDRLLAENISERRRFMDRMVYALHPDHLTHINRYEEAMRNRNRVLQERASDAPWLNALEDAMAKDGVAIASARLHWLQALLPFMADDPAPFPRLALKLEGLAETQLLDQAAVDVEENLRRAFYENRSEDARSGTTRLGPHRTGLVVTHLGNQCTAELCSTGEQKALIISLVLTQTQLLTSLQNETPLLLLDDVMAHLDEKRRAALAQKILDLGVQAWLSGTDKGFFAGFGDKAAFYNVAQGHIAPLDV